jgi:hypothetical protein
MRTQLSRISLFVLALLVFFSAGAYAQDRKDAYTGTAVGTGGSFGGKMVTFNFNITQYTSDDELQSLAELVKEKGTNALRQALEKKNVGHLNVTGTLGNDIAIARKRQDGPDTIISIVTARIMNFAEVYHNGRSVDYPFGFLQVKLDASGNGRGQIMVAAKIRFNKKSGKYEIESFGNQYIKAENVRPQ